MPGFPCISSERSENRAEGLQSRGRGRCWGGRESTGEALKTVRRVGVGGGEMCWAGGQLVQRPWGRPDLGVFENRKQPTEEGVGISF